MPVRMLPESRVDERRAQQIAAKIEVVRRTRNSSEESEAYRIELVTRYYRLSPDQRREVGIILAEESRFYLALDRDDLWGSKVRLTLDEFDMLLRRAESC